jgi:putative ABC transport system permease protein
MGEEPKMPDWKPEIRRRLANLKLEPAREAAIIEELSQHLDDCYEELLAGGATPAEAERRTRAELSDSEFLARELRRVERQIPPEPIAPGTNRRTNMIADLWQDLRYGVRMLVKRPGFALVAVFVLALALGANTAIFSVIEGVLLRPLPYRDADRLCVLWKSVPARNIEWDWTSYPTIRDWIEQSHTFEEMAVMMRPEASEVSLQTNDGPEKIQGSKVSGNFFEMLGVAPLLGRAFSTEEARQGADVGVLSYGFWQQRFGADPAVIGRTLPLDDRSVTIIGVMPGEFQFPNDRAQLWLLVTADHRWTKFQEIRLADAFCALGRLKSGVSLAAARTEMEAIAARLAREQAATDANLSVRVTPLAEQIAGAQLRRTLWVLGGAALCVLLIACSNIASLLLARGATRQKELAVRAALGAGRWRLLRQLATENILLSLLGGLTGLLLAAWGLRALLALMPFDLPRADGIALNGSALAFAFGLCLLVGLVFGMLPAAQTSGKNLAARLRDGSRAATANPGVQRLRGLLVIFQLALAIVLLTGAGLLIRSFLLLDAVKPCFDTSHLLTMSMELPYPKYEDDARRQAFFAEAMQKIEALPGVRGAAVGGAVFDSFKGHAPNQNLVIEGRPAVQETERHGRNTVSDEYFRVMGIPLRQGRLFSAEDRPGGSQVAVINETMARRYWPNENPLGKRFKQVLPGMDAPWVSVVGVVGDVVYNRDGEVIPVFYWSTRQLSWIQMSLVVRTAVPPLSLAGAVRQAVRSVDSAIPNFEITTVEQALANLDRSRRAQTLLLGAAALIALILAALGLYGLLSYLVEQRTPEIGIRVALGAQRRDVLKLVIGQGMKLALAGVALGVGTALALTRLLKGLLFGVSATDPLTIIAITILLMIVALMACWLPARRATKIDPMIALRTE